MPRNTFRTSFNSTLVQLKALTSQTLAENYYSFQFYLSSIKRLY